jgi:putative transposase
VVTPASMDPGAWLRQQLEHADTDLLREMVRSFADALMSADADAVCGAEYGKVSDERVNRRNGYRRREWDTRAGTVELSIPKLRRESHFPTWLIEPRRRAEQALVQVIADCYLAGVSTRRVDKLVKQLGLDGISKSQVSELAKTLDETVEGWRSRPLDASPYTYVWVDALTQKVREGGRIVNVAVVHAVGVNADGHRETLGIDVITTEDGAGWTAFLRSLVARGLSGVQLVISDAHAGLKDAVAAVLPGASWQRCRTHFMRNLLSRVPKSAHGLVAPLVRSIFEQPDADSAWAQHAPGGRAAHWPVRRRRGPAGRVGRPDPGVHLLPESALASAAKQQPVGAAQQRDPQKDRRGRNLPQPRRGHPPGRCRARRAARRVAGRPPLHVRRLAHSRTHTDHRSRQPGGPARPTPSRLTPRQRPRMAPTHTPP